MESVAVADGGEAVLVVALEGVPYKEITWYRSGKPLASSSNYVTYNTDDASNLVIHKATYKDTGTYTLIATKSDGTEARASVLLHVTNSDDLKVSNAPRFMQHLTDITSKVGTHARFLVELQGCENVQVHWYHCNKEITESERVRILNEGNFYCLDVSSLTPEDEGSWRCTVESPIGQINSTASLTVIVPKGYKSPAFLDNLDAILTAEGTVALECKVVGVPTPLLKWYKDGKEIRAGDIFALTANPNDPTSLGTYKCEAGNCMGKASSTSKVRVLSRENSIRTSSSLARTPTPVGPPEKLLEDLEDQKARIGENAKLAIKVSNISSEIQSVTWYNNGKAIEPSDKYRLCDEGGGRYSLSISTTERGDDGEWKVVVKTEAGYAYSNCTLTLSVPRNYRPPRFLENLKALLTEEGLVSFECKVVGYPTPELLWYKDGEELKPGDVYQLSGTNSLGKYSCIARNCMGTTDSGAELTLDDIKPHLNDTEREELLAKNAPPKFIQGLRSKEFKIGESARLSVQVTTNVSYSVSWHRDDDEMESSDSYLQSENTNGQHFLDILYLALVDQAEWKCIASNEFGHSVSSANIKLLIPRQYKQPVFLESLTATLSQEGTVNLECKVIGVPQPTLNWYKDGVQLKPGDIHKIISGEGGTCGLGTYTCEATNCMGTVSSSAALLSYEAQAAFNENNSPEMIPPIDHKGLVKNPSLSTINEERSSQVSIYESAMDMMSNEDKAEVSVSIDGRDISLSLYETPDLSENEAKQIAEMYSEEISDHFAGNIENVAQLPPLRFTKETSCKGSVVTEATVIDVESDAFEDYISFVEGGFEDLRTEADFEELSIIEPVFVEEKETYISDIADIPVLGALEERDISVKTTSFQGGLLPQLEEVYVLDTDLKTLSEQGINLLQDHPTILAESLCNSHASVHQVNIINNRTDGDLTPILTTDIIKPLEEDSMEIYSTEESLVKNLHHIENVTKLCMAMESDDTQEVSPEISEDVIRKNDELLSHIPSVIIDDDDKETAYSIEHIPCNTDGLPIEDDIHSINTDHINLRVHTSVETERFIDDTKESGNIYICADSVTDPNAYIVSFPEDDALLSPSHTGGIYFEETIDDHLSEELRDIYNTNAKVTFIDDGVKTEKNNTSTNHLLSMGNFVETFEIGSSPIEYNIIDESTKVTSFDNFAEPSEHACVLVVPELQMASGSIMPQNLESDKIRKSPDETPLFPADICKLDNVVQLKYQEVLIDDDLLSSCSSLHQNEILDSQTATLTCEKLDDVIMAQNNDARSLEIIGNNSEVATKEKKLTTEGSVGKTDKTKNISLALELLDTQKSDLIIMLNENKQRELIQNETNIKFSENSSLVENNNFLIELELKAIERMQCLLEDTARVAPILLPMDEGLKMKYEIEESQAEATTLFIFKVKENILGIDKNSEDIVKLDHLHMNEIKQQLLEKRSNLLVTLNAPNKENNSKIELLAEINIIEREIKDIISAQVEMAVVFAFKEPSTKLPISTINELSTVEHHNITTSSSRLNEIDETHETNLVRELLKHKRKDLENEIQGLKYAKELYTAGSSIKEYNEESEQNVDFQLINVASLEVELSIMEMQLNTVVVMEDRLIQSVPQLLLPSEIGKTVVPKECKLNIAKEVFVQDYKKMVDGDSNELSNDQAISQGLTLEQLINKRNELICDINLISEQKNIKAVELLSESEENTCEKDNTITSNLPILQNIEIELKKVMASILLEEVQDLLRHQNAELKTCSISDRSLRLELIEAEIADVEDARKVDQSLTDILIKNTEMIDLQKLSDACKLMGSVKATLQNYINLCEDLNSSELLNSIICKNTGELAGYLHLLDIQMVLSQLEDLENILQNPNITEAEIQLLLKLNDSIKNLPLFSETHTMVNTSYKVEYDEIKGSPACPMIKKSHFIKKLDASFLETISEKVIPFEDVKRRKDIIESKIKLLSKQIEIISGSKSTSDWHIAIVMQEGYILKQIEMFSNELKVLSEIETCINSILGENNIEELDSKNIVHVKSETVIDDMEQLLKDDDIVSTEYDSNKANVLVNQKDYELNEIYKCNENNELEQSSLSIDVDDGSKRSIISFKNDKGVIDNIEIQLERQQLDLSSIHVTEEPTLTIELEKAHQNVIDQIKKEEQEKSLINIIDKKRQVLEVHKKMLEERQKIAEVTTCLTDTDEVSFAIEEAINLENHIENLEEQLHLLITAEKEIKTNLSIANIHQSHERDKDNTKSEISCSVSESKMSEDVNKYQEEEGVAYTEILLAQKRKQLEDEMVEVAKKHERGSSKTESGMRDLDMELENVIAFLNDIIIEKESYSDPHMGNIATSSMLSENKDTLISSKPKLKLVYQVIEEDMVDNIEEIFTIDAESELSSAEHDVNVQYILMSDLREKNDELVIERECLLQKLEDIEKLDFTSPKSIDILESIVPLRARLENLDEEIQAIISAKIKADISIKANLESKEAIDDSAGSETNISIGQENSTDGSMDLNQCCLDKILPANYKNSGSEKKSSCTASDSVNSSSVGVVEGAENILSNSENCNISSGDHSQNKGTDQTGIRQEEIPARDINDLAMLSVDDNTNDYDLLKHYNDDVVNYSKKENSPPKDAIYCVDILEPIETIGEMEMSGFNDLENELLKTDINELKTTDLEKNFVSHNSKLHEMIDQCQYQEKNESYNDKYSENDIATGVSQIPIEQNNLVDEKVDNMGGEKLNNTNIVDIKEQNAPKCSLHSVDTEQFILANKSTEILCNISDNNVEINLESKTVSDNSIENKCDEYVVKQKQDEKTQNIHDVRKQSESNEIESNTQVENISKCEDFQIVADIQEINALNVMKDDIQVQHDEIAEIVTETLDDVMENNENISVKDEKCNINEEDVHLSAGMDNLSNKKDIQGIKYLDVTESNSECKNSSGKQNVEDLKEKVNNANHPDDVSFANTNKEDDNSEVIKDFVNGVCATKNRSDIENIQDVMEPKKLKPEDMVVTENANAELLHDEKVSDNARAENNRDTINMKLNDKFRQNEEPKENLEEHITDRYMEGGNKIENMSSKKEQEISPESEDRVNLNNQKSNGIMEEIHGKSNLKFVDNATKEEQHKLITISEKELQSVTDSTILKDKDEETTQLKMIESVNINKDPTNLKSEVENNCNKAESNKKDNENEGTLHMQQNKVNESEKLDDKDSTDGNNINQEGRKIEPNCIAETTDEELMKTEKDHFDVNNSVKHNVEEDKTKLAQRVSHKDENIETLNKQEEECCMDDETLDTQVKVCNDGEHILKNNENYVSTDVDDCKKVNEDENSLKMDNEICGGNIDTTLEDRKDLLYDGKDISDITEKLVDKKDGRKNKDDCDKTLALIEDDVEIKNGSDNQHIEKKLSFEKESVETDGNEADINTNPNMSEDESLQNVSMYKITSKCMLNEEIDEKLIEVPDKSDTFSKEVPNDVNKEKAEKNIKNRPNEENNKENDPVTESGQTHVPCGIDRNMKYETHTDEVCNKELIGEIGIDCNDLGDNGLGKNDKIENSQLNELAVEQDSGQNVEEKITEKSNAENINKARDGLDEIHETSELQNRHEGERINEVTNETEICENKGNNKGKSESKMLIDEACNESKNDINIMTTDGERNKTDGKDEISSVDEKYVKEHNNKELNDETVTEDKMKKQSSKSNKKAVEKKTEQLNDEKSQESKSNDLFDMTLKSNDEEIIVKSELNSEKDVKENITPPENEDSNDIQDENERKLLQENKFDKQSEETEENIVTKEEVNICGDSMESDDEHKYEESVNSRGGSKNGEGELQEKRTNYKKPNTIGRDDEGNEVEHNDKNESDSKEIQLAHEEYQHDETELTEVHHGPVIQRDACKSEVDEMEQGNHELFEMDQELEKNCQGNNQIKNDNIKIMKSESEANVASDDINYEAEELVKHHRERGGRTKLMPSEDKVKTDVRKKPKFSTKLQDRQVPKGTRIKLSCNIVTSMDERVPNVEWFKDGFPLREDNKIKASFIEGIASLEIGESTKSDSGEYTCSTWNAHGRRSTTCDVKIKGDEAQKTTAPTFTTSLRERFMADDNELEITCHVTGHPQPKIKWLKNADQLPTSPRFYTSMSDDGICKLMIKAPKAGDTGLYTCHAENRIYRDEISATIHVQGLLSPKPDDLQPERSELPRFVTELCDQLVKEHGTLTLQVEAVGKPAPDVIWLFNGRTLPPSGKYRISTAGNIHTLTVFQVAKHDIGTYSCKLRNKLGSAYTLSTVSFGSPKPKRKFETYSDSSTSASKSTSPTFAERPDSLVTVFRGEEIRLSCMVQGDPVPRVSWRRRNNDITYMGRAHATIRDNRHIIVISNAEFTDSGTYTVEAQNAEGSSRAYCSIKVRERMPSRSYSPRKTSKNKGSQLDSEIEIKRRTGTYIRDLPGLIGVPQVTDVGYNWVCLAWKKSEKTGGGPVTAYKVESWILGEEARWQELGISPIPSFDVYNLKTDKEYLFRVTPRNRYGWGESVLTSRAVRVGRIVEHPSFPKSLPTQVRCMPGGSVYLEAHVAGDPIPIIHWYKDGTVLDASRYPRFETAMSDGTINQVFGIVHKVSIEITDLHLEDEGRYELEAVNPGGRITCGTKILPTYDYSVLQAQEHINRTMVALSRLDEVSCMTPQFTMRLRDRRVQVGFPVRLTCQVLAVPKPTINWMKDGVPLVSDDYHTIWQENSYFYTLEISSATHEDADVYSVMANNEFGSIMCRSRLVVDSGLKSYISPMFLKELEDVSVHEGEDIMLHVIIESYPTIGVVWHRDGHRIRASRRAHMNLTTDGSACMIVRDAEYIDGGIYSCTASNEMGRMESFCRVSVESSDHSLRHGHQRAIKAPMFLRISRCVEAEEKAIVNIECEATGDPSPSVNWLKEWFDSDVSINNPRFQQIDSGSVFRLEIQDCRLEDSGAYAVVAHNEHGEPRAIISLQIHPGLKKSTEEECIRRGVMEHFPKVVKHLQDIKCCDGDSLTLETVIKAPKYSKIRWEKQGKVLKTGGDITTAWDGSHARLHIREVYPEDEGEYSCIVYNDFGKTVTSSTIVVEMANNKENDLTVQMDHRPDLSRRSTPSRYSRSPSVNFQREGSAHSWAEVGWREPSVAISQWRPLSRGSSPLLLGTRRAPDIHQRSKGRTFQRPKFYYIPHDRIVEEGDSVTFQCAVKGHPVPRTVWDKDSSRIIPGGRMKMEEKNEIRYLEIPKVTQQDAGLYRVTIENDFGREQATARLDVIKASQHKYLGYVRSWNSAPLTTPKFTRTLTPTTVRSGTRLSLSTKFRGSPKPRAKWYKNGQLIPMCREYRQTNDGFTCNLDIIKMSTSDAGIYTCVLVNMSGKAESSCQVIVEDMKMAAPTPPSFVGQLKDITAHDGDQVTISAEIQGSSPLKIIWVKDDVEVKSSSEFKYESKPPTYSLVIADAFQNDSAIYFCEAYNSYGQSISHARVTIIDPHAPNPEAPKIHGPLGSITVHEGDAAQFRIKGSGVPYPEVTWYLNGRQLKDTNRFQIRTEDCAESRGLVYCLRILPALLSDSGTISILMENSLGSECLHTTFQVNILPYKRTPPTQKMTDISESNPTSPNATPSLKSSSPVIHSPRISPPSWNRIQQKVAKQDSMDSAYASGRNSALSIADRESNSERPSPERNGDTKTIPEVTDLESLIYDHGEETGAVIISGPNDTTALKSQCATLTATFNGYPTPRITWYKKEKEIQNGGRYNIKVGKIITSLTITDVTFDDCDKYTLKVHNHLSAHSSFASLAVEGVPEPPSGKPNLSAITNTSVTVSWYGPAYDGGKAITGYKVEARRIGTSSWYSLVNSCHSTSYKAEGFEPGSQYEFRVFAINKHGMSESSLTSSPISLHDGCSGSVESLHEYEGHYGEHMWRGVVDLQPSDMFEQNYEQHEEVGKGRFGIVYKVSEKAGGRKRAAKIIKCLKAEDRTKVKAEIAIMNALKHPKLLQLLAAFERKKDFVMIMEYISGGELFERVVADDFSLTERDCILFIRQICEGVKYMHENSIVHLDLKPENILCVTRTSHRIKLIDFGLARKLDPEKPCRVLFGTPEFVAPEIINYEPISFSSDMWSVGVICYVLLSGLSPFMGENDAETFANITRAEFDFDDDSFDAISEDAKNFINKLLDKRKEKRPSAIGCLETGWLAQKEGSTGHVVLSTDKLKRFVIRRKWQKTGNAIRALGRMANLTNQRNSSPTRITVLHDTKSPIPLSPSSSSNQPMISNSVNIGVENVNKNSTGIVNERSDSGISEWSECSTVPEDRAPRPSFNNSLPSITQNSISTNGHNGVSGTGKRAGLAWQLSIDSAVEEEEELVGKTIFVTRRKSSKDVLMPVKEMSPNTLHKNHSRV